MRERTKGKSVEAAAAKANMSVNTARKYIASGSLPSEQKTTRRWRTRKNPFAKYSDEIDKLLDKTPDLEAKTIFEFLCDRYPGELQEGQLRTLQRHIRQWRAESGPEQNVVLPQEHIPGEAFQTDFTWGTKLGVSIAGVKYKHMLCNVTLPFSNWQWATICQSESVLSLKKGIQAAIFQLGYVPKYNQTDNSTSATHNLSSGKRAFNDKYIDFLRHFGMSARTIAVGASCQNGDVESLNRSLKRRISQYLMLRGSSDFSTVEEYQTWINKIVLKTNKLRSAKLEVEVTHMTPVSASPLPEYTVEKCLVNTASLIRVKRNSYSVPSRLIGQVVSVHIYDDMLRIYLGSKLQIEVARLQGRDKSQINYRHIIWSLLKKPGAFQRYKYREEMFPSLIFRKSYDRLICSLSEREADLEYLRILHLAAAVNQFDVETAINLLLDENHNISYENVRDLVECKERVQPEVKPLDVDLNQYDFFIKEGVDD